MKLGSSRVIVWGVVLLGVLFLNQSVLALTASQLQNVKVVGYHFATEITSTSYRASLNDTEKSRYVIVKLSGLLTGSEGKIFSNDFQLVYQHANGKEDRAKCSGIADCKTDTPGEIESFVLGEASWMKASPGIVNFAVAFVVESDVDTVYIYRSGTSDVVTVPIGRDRKYSVYITTNRSDTKIASEVKQIISDGGYDVTMVSNGLDSSETGTTIQYREKAEAAAREMSQRLMVKYGILPKVQKMELVSEVDIVVWLGK